MASYLSRVSFGLCMTVAAFSCAPAYGQDSKSMAAAFPNSMAAEHKAFSKEMEGQYYQSLIAFEEALNHCLENETAPIDARSARVEYLARRLNFLIGKVELYKQGAKLFEDLVKSKRINDYARGRLRSYLIEQLQMIGQLKKADEHIAKLGYIQSWQLIGPFANERGTGFSRRYPIEKELIFNKSYKGKASMIRWRPLPTKNPPSGLVSLDTLYNPNTQCLAYGLTYLHCKSPQSVALRFASDEAIKVWVNGGKVLAHDRRRPINFDQSSVGVKLRKGWNVILVKVCNQTGSWSFRGRITTPSGAPLSTISQASTAEIPALAAKHGFCGGKSTELAKYSEGGRAWYDEHLKKNTKDGDACFQRAYLAYTHQADDKGVHRDRKLFDQARTLQSKNSTYHLFYSYTATESGEYSVNKEENKRRQALELAIKLAPRNAQARYRLASYYSYSLGSNHQARPFIKQALKINPYFEDALYLLARIESSERLGIITERREAKLEGKIKSSTFLKRRASRADGLGQTGKAIDIYESILKRLPGSWDARLSLAAAYKKMGLLDAAMKQYEHLIKLDPYDIISREDLANLYVAKSQMKDAISLLEKALLITPQDTALLQKIGRWKRLIGDKKGSLKMFERSLLIKRNDPALKRYIRFLKQDQKPPFEKEWITPSDKIIAAAKKIPINPELSHRILHRNVITKVGKDGLASTFEQEIYRIENDSGVSGFRSISKDYFVGEQHVIIQEAKIYRKTGEIEQVPVGESYDWGAGEFGRYSSYSVSFPPLNVGDVIEVKSRIDTLKHGFFGDYFQATENLRSTVPIDSIRIAYILPKSRPFYFRESRGAPKQMSYEKGENKITIYQTGPVEKLVPEPYMPWAKEVMPRVSVSTFKDWNAFAVWYWALVRHQHESNKEIEALVKRITKGAKSDQEKIRKIYEYVVTDIRYTASWEFGVHGFKPYNATNIFARKFGDCKDKSTLINTMLRHVNIKSYPVLIFGAEWSQDNRGVEDIDLPLISHFNHCISYVMPDGKRKGLFLDGTAQYHPYGTLPSMDYGARVVVVTPEGALIKTIPVNSAAENSVTELSHITIKADGSARFKTRLRGKGSFETVLRSQLQNEGRRKEVLERILGRRYPGAKVLSVKCNNLMDLNKAIQIEMTVELKNGWRNTADGKSLIPLKSWLYDALSPKTGDLASKVKRNQDLILPNPSALDETVIYEVPPGSDFNSVPKKVSLKTPFGSYERSYKVEGNKIISTRKFKLTKTRIKQSEYKAFRSFTTEIEKAESERVLLKPAPSVPN
ncbi:MAG: DUF3857 domain-containing protein [Planctomycetota bacterium]|nr:DUF3857 domain-containing protein [Planctomycetota bacterium]